MASRSPCYWVLLSGSAFARPVCTGVPDIDWAISHRSRSDRGVLAVGKIVDVVVFDPERYFATPRPTVPRSRMRIPFVSSAVLVLIGLAWDKPAYRTAMS
ncbi:hypothetical protein [Nocardia macrotermitis]|uniref:Amidohydrolase 3 domain-containing protein n=1 Tax=Nocardia macrotermitis TaxID=2585198 RepID=A0A7K0D6N2_9NOCA|nr:hypothetical protein [Nocardia macrotermitis]MQY20982.1 hypothetical protein [Nocardia macrotermitis]